MHLDILLFAEKKLKTNDGEGHKDLQLNISRF